MRGRLATLFDRWVAGNGEEPGGDESEGLDVGEKRERGDAELLIPGVVGWVAEKDGGLGDAGEAGGICREGLS